MRGEVVPMGGIDPRQETDARCGDLAGGGPGTGLGPPGGANSTCAVGAPVRVTESDIVRPMTTRPRQQIENKADLVIFDM